jgi:hypothetical protein
LEYEPNQATKFSSEYDNEQQAQARLNAFKDWLGAGHFSARRQTW